MNLSQLRPPKGQKHKRQRVGQGIGTGRGKVLRPRSQGYANPSPVIRGCAVEGGQMPLHRLPKRGFTNIFRKEFAIVNVAQLEMLEGDSFDAATLLKLGVIHKLKDGLKILGTGELKRRISVKAHVFSKSAAEKIQAAGRPLR